MDHTARASITVASWNINAVRGASPNKLTDVATALAKHTPDLVVLQEVHAFRSVPEQLQAEMATIGLDHVHFSGTPALRETKYGDKAYGNMIASRWNLQPRAWPVKTEWPQLIVAAEVDTPLGELLIVGTHIPNGTGNGWEKVYALEALTDGLTAARMPVILVGDFNEPRTFTPAMTSFGADDRGATEGTFTDVHGITHERLRWQRAVEAALAPGDERNAWGGHHVVTQVGIAFEATHLAGGRLPRMFDHILTTRPLRARAARYDHTVRQPPNRISDHSIVTATIERA